MSDPLSIAGTVAGLISLGILVTQSLADFYSSYKHQDSELIGTIEKLDSLLNILQSLKKALSNRKFEVDEKSLIKNIETSIENCDELIHELQGECQKFSKVTSNGIKAVVKIAGRRATYPFRKSTLQKLDEDISELHDNLSTALGVLQLRDNKIIQADIVDVKHLLKFLRTNQISENIRSWLKAPDATVNHNVACAKRYSSTGSWLVQSSRFETWLTEGNSFLWLNGFAGSGKSVLASTAIQFAYRHRRSDPSIGIAFFYFTFNDESKQDESAMLRALLVQLSGQLRDGHSDLARLHDSFNHGIPPSSVLADHLQRLIERFHHVYIILDALDEVPPSRAREDVLDRIEMMQNWSLTGLHLLVTSRDLPDIRRSLSFSSDQEVKMRNAGIDEDIKKFISSRLREDRRLKKWLPYRGKIEETLAKRAQGVFRWVECQFQSLKLCPCSENHLDKLLNSLPQSLDETYERMLCGIDDSLIEDAQRILTLLCFAARPLTVLELIDGVAVEINPPRLNAKRRLQDADDVLEICPGLVDVDIVDIMIHQRKQQTQTVRIAHFSVQEYLESGRIQRQKADIFSLPGGRAHAEIAQICLIYWLEPGLAVTELDKRLLEKYPLANFAAEFWYHHYTSAENLKPQLENLILKLFQRQKDLFLTWIKLLSSELSDLVFFYEFTDFIGSKSSESPVYYASLLGLGQVLQELLSSNQQGEVMTYTLPKTSTSQDADTNIKNGVYGHPLEAASSKSYEKITELLVTKDADIHAQGGFYGNALQAASVKGHENIVRLLIEKGADIHAQGGFYGNALQAASYRGLEEMVQLLIEKGADINTQGGLYGNALQAALDRGHENIARLLIEKGADIHAQGGFYGNALQAASYGGLEDIVQLLIEKGADINAQGGLYGNALQAASLGGHEDIVQLLIAKGADINAEGGDFGNALQAALVRGHENIARLLIEKGADIHAKGEHHCNALQAASYGGLEDIVQLLIEKGADINAQGGLYGNALQVASLGGHEDIVQLLIEKGADINAEGGDFGNALQAASAGVHENRAQLLIENFCNVLQAVAASAGVQESIVQLLIEKGADIHAQGGFYGNALRAAKAGPEPRNKKIVQLLIENGATDVEA